MELNELPIDPRIITILEKDGIKKLTPGQEKAINAGLLDNNSILTCIPTAAGKTLIAELVATKKILEGKKAIYIVPLKALASEKFKDFKRKYESLFKVALSIGDKDTPDYYLENYDLILCTSEKLDALLRHHAPWVNDIGVIIIDEIHLLNDPGRGPTLEILITILRRILKNVQIIGLSATIGNPNALADWLGAKLVEDDWRPCKLHKGVHFEGKIEFKK